MEVKEKIMKLPESITEGALIQRLNRYLRAEEQVVRKTRGNRQLQDFGEYYILDFNRNWVVASWLTLEKLEDMAREYNLLEDWETTGRAA
jgi:hypothetical protein